MSMGLEVRSLALSLATVFLNCYFDNVLDFRPPIHVTLRLPLSWFKISTESGVGFPIRGALMQRMF